MSTALKTTSRLKTKRRPGDPWISKNRVLNGGGSKSKRNCPIYRNPNFDTDETKLLIQLWGDPKVQRELITTHKKHVVISQLSAKMEEYGYFRSPEEITTRIKNMKCFYNRLKKDMETTKNMDPSWRHFSEMDAIMMRPIFSVRPNEVPAPSLKYLLEQEQEKRKERKRKAEEEGSIISDSDEDIADILAVPNAATNAIITTTKEASRKSTDKTEITAESEANDQENLENDLEQSNKVGEKDKNDQSISEAEMAIKMEIESEQFQEYQSTEEAGTTNKEGNRQETEEPIKTINLSEDEDLLVPKVEPIDVDEEFERLEKQTTPTTPTAKQNFTKLADILKQPAISQMIKFAMPANSSTVTISSASSSTAAPSKISVVSPTILMPPQMSPKSTITTTTDQRQVRLPSNLHALLAASGSRTTVTNGNGMKFLLVNAADKRGPPITTANLTSTIPITGNNRPTAVMNQGNVKIIQNTTPLQQQQQQQQQFQQKPQMQNFQQKSLTNETTKRSEIRQEYREQLKKRDLVGIKSALLKMLKVQEDTNEIQKERLAIERERLQYERTLSDRFLSIFEQNQKIQQQMQQQQQLIQQQQAQKHHIQLQQRSTVTPQVFTTNTGQAAVPPNGQMMLPPKLLITTMLPTSSAQAATGSTQKVLTTTSFTNLSATPSSDLQLVAPKEEPQN